MIEILSRVELEVITKGDESYVKVPTFRQDIEFMADIAEEVARFFGYDKIPTTLPVEEAIMGGVSYKIKIEDIARLTASFSGFSEAMNYSFESPKVFSKLRLSEDSEYRKAIEILNPLGEDFSIMRTLPLGGLLQSLSTNYNRRNKAVKLYEFANVYRPKELPLRELPDERIQFTLGFYGDGDFYDMKGVCEQFFSNIGLKEKISYTPNPKREFLHPGRNADIFYKGINIGYLGEVHPEVLDNFKIGERTYIAVIDMKNVTTLSSFDIKYIEIPRYPAITRDISLVVPRAITAGEIEDVFSLDSGSILEKYELFDIYEGSQVLEGYKSIAYSITFRHKERTLEDKEVNEVMEKILKHLEKLGIKLRA